jgi:hypothetical protein
MARMQIYSRSEKHLKCWRSVNFLSTCASLSKTSLSLMHLVFTLIFGTEEIINYPIDGRPVTFTLHVLPHDAPFPSSRLGWPSVEIEVEITLQLTASQSVCQGIEPTLRLVTRYYFLSEDCCRKVARLVSVWRPLWREVGSVICHCQSAVIYQYLHQTFTLHVFYSSAIYIQYR